MTGRYVPSRMSGPVRQLMYDLAEMDPQPLARVKELLGEHKRARTEGEARAAERKLRRLPDMPSFPTVEKLRFAFNVLTKGHP